ncbi:Protein CBG17865 [Caenorhabditis briggsae]|uniref:Protein CBG17865 n=1 Tax=Caenorhabditis briggsae TaxID=6238 RepID=A8XRZ1_CAEBR|nr:Protein CBG17865 [Caenorhabditis briggsae]CAP35410.1 Protein CBG17865 [Caenorhabditis briggsae]
MESIFSINVLLFHFYNKNKVNQKRALLLYQPNTIESQDNSDQLRVLLHREFRPRKDPPQLKRYSLKDTSVPQVNSDQLNACLHQEFRPREDPLQPQMSQSKDKDQLKTCLHQEFRPRKDPPRMRLHGTRGYELQPEKFQVHLHHEFRPRKDPPCRDHYHNMPPRHYGSITDSWSNFVIDVHG